MNASASEAIAARISKEQSQLEDALLHASAIAHDIQSQSSSSSMIYNDVIIHDEERPLKRRNIEVPLLLMMKYTTVVIIEPMVTTIMGSIV